MYDNILHKPLVMRPGASSSAWSLLQGLLEKDGTHRLGSRDDFVSEIIQCTCPDTGTCTTEYLYFWAPSSGWSVYIVSLLLIHYRSTVIDDFQTFYEYKIKLLCILHFQNEIREHSFFSSINWDDLVQKKISPPFTPNVVNVSCPAIRRIWRL